MSMNPRYLLVIGTLFSLGLASLLVLTSGDLPRSEIHAGDPSRGGALDRARDSVELVELAGLEARELEREAGVRDATLGTTRGRFGPEVPVRGQTATLVGRMSNGGDGVPLTLEFVAGPNRGVTIECGADGTYRADRLYPGFAVLTARTPTSICRSIFVQKDR